MILDNIRYVFISMLIALPSGWILMSRWLRNYAYRVEFSWWTLLLAGLIALMISLLATTFQIYRKATSSPLKSLRYV